MPSLRGPAGPCRACLSALDFLLLGTRLRRLALFRVASTGRCRALRVLAVTVASLAIACVEGPPPPFTLYVSNQSFEHATVGVTITIDGQVVVDQDFDVEGQHNWFTFTPDVGPGDHTLIAVSDTGAELTVEFNLPDDEPRWAVVDYWWYPEEGPRRFTFNISDEPIYFM